MGGELRSEPPGRNLRKLRAGREEDQFDIDNKLVEALNFFVSSTTNPKVKGFFYQLDKQKRFFNTSSSSYVES